MNLNPWLDIIAAVMAVVCWWLMDSPDHDHH